MKVYFLRLTEDDFPDKDGNVWTSGVVDLYENDVYTNFSVTKSTYGFDAPVTWLGLERTTDLLLDDFEPFTFDDLRNATWLGEEFHTDTGKVVGDRYIDQSGRIDLVSWNIEDAPPGTRLVVRNSDIDDPTEDWDTSPLLRQADEIAFVDASQFAQFKLDFNQDTPSQVEIFVRVEIDRPVIAPLYRMTRKLADQFPEWTTIHEDGAGLYDDVEDPGAAEVPTPDSLGGSFLNAISGEWLEDIRKELTYRDFQRYIGTVDLAQMAWAYKTSTNVPEFIWNIEGDGTELARTSGWQEFRQAVDEDACFIDYENRTIYTVKEYDDLQINAESFYQEPHLVWNYLDEIGLYVDLERLPLEDNETYKARILDVYKNRGGVGVESLKKALRRELNLWHYMENMAPDSDFEGAYPEILEMEDLERDPKYFGPDGMPTEEFVDLVEQLSREYPTTWGRFVWGRAVWDIAGDNYEGYNVVPYRYDAEPRIWESTQSYEGGTFVYYEGNYYRVRPSVQGTTVGVPPDDEDSNEWTLEGLLLQSGVGDGDDLYVFRPDTVTGARDFEYTMQVKGRERVWRTEYPKVEFDCLIRGKAEREYYDNPTIAVWLTLEIEATDSETYVYSFEMTSQSDVGHDQVEATSDSYDIFDFLEDGPETSPDLEFTHAETEEPYNETGVIPFEDIVSITLKHGRWDHAEEEYIEKEEEDTFEAWFSHMDEDVVTYDSIDEVSYGPDEEELEEASIILKSKVVADPVVDDWYSDEFPYHIELNGIDPYLDPSPVDVDVPEISWDPHLVENSETIEIKLETTNAFTDDEIEDPDYGAVTHDIEGNTLFLPADIIEVDGNNSWSSEGIHSLSASTESFTFSTGEEVGVYPMEVPVWDPFKAEQTVSAQGVVDQHGPWRNGVPPKPGNTNFRLEVVEGLTRDDFDIPHNDDFVVTWIGVKNDENDRVITWLDNNTVRPALTDEEDYDQYPETAVIESIEDDIYFYDPVPVNVRLRPFGPEWNPQVHSGYFFMGSEEYYFYARRETETTDAQEYVLETVARQGAPVIVHTEDAEGITTLRQVAFFDEDASAPSLNLQATYKISGSNEEELYLPHHDVYNVAVVDSDGDPVAADTETVTNVLPTNVVTDKAAEYTVTYTLRHSFYVDYDHVEDDEPRTKLVFDDVPDTEYVIDYESSIYDPAREVDLPLNPFYSVHTEGFIFISYNEYTLDSLRVRLSPVKILADGRDYIMVTINSMDRFGNPKPEQHFELETTFGTLDKEEVTTDHDGFAVIILTAEENFTTEVGTLSITGEVNAEVDFEIEEPSPPQPRILAAPNVESLQANGTNRNIIHGKIEGPDFQPIDNVTVDWKKARSIYELFTGAETDSGSVTTNTNGRFYVGPFTVTESEDSGYWFVSMEAEVNGFVIGDVVFWYEYPMSIMGVENTDGLPQRAVQMEEPPGTHPRYSEDVRHPTRYFEEEADPAPQPVTVQWLPPSWYAIDAQRQYQLGIDSHETYNGM